MSFAVLQITKLKYHNISGVSRHINRALAPANVDRSRSHLNVTVLGSANPEADVFSHLAKAGITQPRKDAVLCAGVLLTSDRKFFEDSDGNIDAGKTKSWREASVKWLKETFGANVVNVEDHEDELTPHIHSLVVPLTPDGKLNFKKAIADGRAGLARLHTSYARAMQHLGLIRGVERVRAPAKKVHEHYVGVMTPTPQVVPVPLLPSFIRAPMPAQADPQKYVQEQLEAYERVVKEAAARNEETLILMHAKATEFDDMKAREQSFIDANAALKKQLADSGKDVASKVLIETKALRDRLAEANLQHAAEAEESQKEIADLKAAMNDLRGLHPLDAYRAVKGILLDQSKPQELRAADGSLVQIDRAGRWRVAGNDKAAWKTNAIDLIMHLEDVSAIEAGRRVYEGMMFQDQPDAMRRTEMSVALSRRDARFRIALQDGHAFEVGREIAAASKAAELIAS